MKICFIQKQSFPYFGVMALSAALKKRGHETDVLIYSHEKNMIGELKAINPDFICFSAHTAEHRWLRETISEIRKRMPGVPIIVGGVHATLYPEEILNLDVDYICRGEGEIAFISLVERLSKGSRSAQGIQGIGYLEAGRPVLQGAAVLIQDLDQFPEDRAVYYDRYHELRDLDFKLFMCGRGCPFNCSYCGNALLKAAYSSSGQYKYIRKKSPRFFVDEIKSVVKNYGAKSFYFMDDIFILSYEWLEEFAGIYKAEVGLPYFCLSQAGVMKEKHAKLLSESGCRTISVGLETGNENIRKNVLNKTVSDDDFINCSNILKKYGIKLSTSNMFCLPDETVEDAISTINLNIKIGTSYMATSIFLPYPRTKLADYCIEKGLLDKNYSIEDMPTTFLFESILKRDDKEIFENIQKVAVLCLRFPKIKPFFIFLAKKMRLKPFFTFLYLVGAFLRYKNSMKLTFFQTMRYFWTQRKTSE